MTKQILRIPANLPAVAAIAMLAFSVPLHADVIVATDFTGRTVSGKTANNITYTLSGITDPGDLTYTGTQNLFDTDDAQGHFAPGVNTSTETWAISIPLAFETGVSEIQIAADDVFSIDYQNFNSSGNYQATPRSTSWVATIVGSVSGTVLSDTATSKGDISGTLDFFADASATLENSETWTLVLTTVSPSGSGNRTGLSGFSLSGTPAEGPASPTIWHVMASRTGQAIQDGSSWASAFADLQDAIASASAGDEIWVAAGIYYPDESEAGIAVTTANSTSSNFSLPAEVAIYGGFQGTETDRSERDPSAQVTILSGDIDHETNPDITTNGIVVSKPETNIIGSNASKILSVSSDTDADGEPTAILDGFTITGASDGALFGGGNFRRCVFQGNTSDGWAGAANHNGDTVRYVACDFFGNRGTKAAAVNANNSSIRMTACRVQGNVGFSTEGGRGAALSIGDKDAVLTDCLITGNLADGGAVSVMLSGGSPRSFQLRNSTIANNRQDSIGYAPSLSIDSSAKVTIFNSLIWGNEGTASTPIVGSFSATYCLVEDMSPSGDNYDGTVAGLDPLFREPIATTSAPTTAGDYRVFGQSPVVDSARNDALPSDAGDLDEDGDTAETLPLDLAGHDRETGDPDIGAYEYAGPDIVADPVDQEIDIGSDTRLTLGASAIFTGYDTLTASFGTAGVATFSYDATGLYFDATGASGDNTMVTLLASDSTTGDAASATFTLTLTGTSNPLAAFRSLYGMADDGSDDNSDLSHNGVANIFYYLFGLGDPNESNIDRSLLPSLTKNGDTIVFSYRSRFPVDTITVRRMTSTDLQTWSGTSVLQGTAEASIDASASIEDTDYLRQTITYPIGSNARYFRLETIPEGSPTD